MKVFLNKLYNRIRSTRNLLPSVFPNLFRRLLRSKIQSSDSVCLLIGSGGDKISNWISSDFPVFDITESSHWEYLFSDQQWKNMLAEHVFEHLHLEDLKLVLLEAKKYAADGAIFRIAVPDGFSTIEGYIDTVRPNGTGPGAFDHKLLYDYVVMMKVAEMTNLSYQLVEHFDENGMFHSEYSDANGPIKRSSKNDPRNLSSLQYTSLIVDFYF